MDYCEHEGYGFERGVCKFCGCLDLSWIEPLGENDIEEMDLI